LKFFDILKNPVWLDINIYIKKEIKGKWHKNIFVKYTLSLKKIISARPEGLDLVQLNSFLWAGSNPVMQATLYLSGPSQWPLCLFFHSLCFYFLWSLFSLFFFLVCFFLFVWMVRPAICYEGKVEIPLLEFWMKAKSLFGFSIFFFVIGSLYVVFPPSFFIPPRCMPAAFAFIVYLLGIGTPTILPLLDWWWWFP